MTRQKTTGRKEASRHTYVSSLSLQCKHFWLFFVPCHSVSHSLLTVSMSTYKLHYFNFRGRGEAPRLIFAAAGEKFDDARFEWSEWSELKSKMTLGQVPVLEYNGTQLPQSKAICRFLAQQFHLAGNDNFEQAKIDAVVDTIGDAFEKLVFIYRAPEATKQDLMKALFADELPKHLTNLEVLAKLYGNGGAYFVGNQLTWADLYFYDIGQSFLKGDATCLDNFPWLKKNLQEVENHPTVAEYLKNRPKTSF